MSTQTPSPIQASDEITDAQLNEISGGARGIDTTATLAVSARPTNVNLSATATLLPQSTPHQAVAPSNPALRHRL